jgi:hypothetical protein
MRPGADVVTEQASDRSTVTAALAREERLVRDLRAALPAEAQTIFFRQFDELLAVLAEPRCAECQADGVPCPHVAVSCEQCGRSVSWVRDLRDAIARSST